MNDPTYNMDLFLDSRSRSTGTLNNCTFNLLVPIRKALNVTLKNFQCYNSQYNINSTNNKLEVTSIGTVTITPGFYDSTTLMNNLQSALNALSSGTWTCSYNATTGLVTIGCNASKTINWTTSTITSVLGFSAGSQTGTSFVGTNILNLSSSFYILIKSQNLVENFNCMTVKGTDFILEKIPINVPMGSLINYQCPNTELSYYEYSSQRDIGVIDIALMDLNNNLINIQTDWSMTVQFELIDE